MEIKATDNYLMNERPIIEKAMKRERRRMKRKKKNLESLLERLEVLPGLEAIIYETRQNIQEADHDLHICEIILEEL